MPVSSKYEIYIVWNKRRDRHIHIHTFTFFIILFHSYLKQLNSKTRKKIKSTNLKMARMFIIRWRIVLNVQLYCRFDHFFALKLANMIEKESYNLTISWSRKISMQHICIKSILQALIFFFVFTYSISCFFRMILV